MLQSLSTWLQLPVISLTRKLTSATPSMIRKSRLSVCDCSGESGWSHWYAAKGKAIRVASKKRMVRSIEQYFTVGAVTVRPVRYGVRFGKQKGLWFSQTIHFIEPNHGKERRFRKKTGGFNRTSIQQAEAAPALSIQRCGLLPTRPSCGRHPGFWLGHRQHPFRL